MNGEAEKVFRRVDEIIAVKFPPGTITLPCAACASHMQSASDPVNEFFDEYPDVVRELAVRLRRLVREMLPDAREELDRSGHVVGYSFGSGYTGSVCTIIMSQTGTKLGLVGSADLPDPNHLLEGTGKRHRYITFKKASDFGRPGIRDLLTGAKDRWHNRSGKKANPFP